MAHHDENAGDSTGLGWIIINLVAFAWITMPLSIGVSRIAF
ncbi:MAG: hypothetical protein ACPGPF_00480 [Pontibacterium sp.]